MNRITLFFVLMFFTSFFESCKEDDPFKESYEHCIDNMHFDCTAPSLGSVYFTGKINGESFCISSGQEDYTNLNAIFFKSTTTPEDPSLNLSNPSFHSSTYLFRLSPPAFGEPFYGYSEDFIPYVTLETPTIRDSTLHSSIFYFEKFITEEGSLPLRSMQVDEYNGFDFSIHWNCVYVPGYEHYRNNLKPNAQNGSIPGVSIFLHPHLGPQNDSTFGIKELKITSFIGIEYYEITFEIECDLYVQQPNGDVDFFGRLEDGIYKTNVSVVL